MAVQTYRFLRIEMSDQKETRCGTVTFKGNRDQVNKHSTETEFILVVLYDDTKRKEDERISAAIWSSYNIGDRICLSSSVIMANVIGSFNTVVALIGCIVLFLSLVVGIIASIAWLFFDKNIFDKNEWKSEY